MQKPYLTVLGEECLSSILSSRISFSFHGAKIDCTVGQALSAVSAKNPDRGVFHTYISRPLSLHGIAMCPDGEKMRVSTNDWGMGHQIFKNSPNKLFYVKALLALPGAFRDSRKQRFPSMQKITTFVELPIIAHIPDFDPDIFGYEFAPVSDEDMAQTCWREICTFSVAVPSVSGQGSIKIGEAMQSVATSKAKGQEASRMHREILAKYCIAISECGEWVQVATSAPILVAEVLWASGIKQAYKKALLALPGAKKSKGGRYFKSIGAASRFIEIPLNENPVTFAQNQQP
jgi:hypothetical protein